MTTSANDVDDRIAARLLEHAEHMAAAGAEQDPHLILWKDR
jgi:hypothetical protein